MIPLRNEHGQIVGFSGRVLPGYSDEFASQAKYLNSPETPLFAKRNFLFNFDLAKKNIRKENKVILLKDIWMLFLLGKRGSTRRSPQWDISYTRANSKLRHVTDTI